MAIARPVRALIGLAVVLWCFFLFQMFKPMPEFHGPADRFINFERDPNLDRTSHRIRHPSPILDSFRFPCRADRVSLVFNSYGRA
jgi:hypothetical protein